MDAVNELNDLNRRLSYEAQVKELKERNDVLGRSLSFFQTDQLYWRGKAEQAEKKLDDLERSILDLSHPNIKSLLEENKDLRQSLKESQHLAGLHYKTACSQLEEISALRKELEKWRSDFGKSQLEVMEGQGVIDSLRHSLEVAREALDGIIKCGGLCGCCVKVGKEALASPSKKEERTWGF